MGSEMCIRDSSFEHGSPSGKSSGDGSPDQSRYFCSWLSSLPRVSISVLSLVVAIALPSDALLKSCVCISLSASDSACKAM